MTILETETREGELQMDNFIKIGNDFKEIAPISEILTSKKLFC